MRNHCADWHTWKGRGHAGSVGGCGCERTIRGHRTVPHLLPLRAVILIAYVVTTFALIVRTLYASCTTILHSLCGAYELCLLLCWICGTHGTLLTQPFACSQRVISFVAWRIVFHRAVVA